MIKGVLFMDMNFFYRLINNAVINVHTAYIAKVISIDGSYAVVQPLTYTKDAGGNTIKQAPVVAFVPANVKYAVKNITYRVSETSTETIDVLVPSDLKKDDIVYCGVCESDISSAVKGIMTELPVRHHNINDSVILRVL